MTTRLDLAVTQHPDHADSIRLFAARDPSKNLKYLDWQVKVLASGQARAGEIADVVDLFHKFRGHPVPAHGTRQPPIRANLYSYRPQDVSGLRDRLLKLKRAQDKKKKKRERLYRIEGAVEAAVVFESGALLVRHIQNKAASMHYGLGTKWCVSMKQENYFDDYDAHNAALFFFERKVKVSGGDRDDFDKAAVLVSRDCTNSIDHLQVFSAVDEQASVVALARAYGPEAFAALSAVYEAARGYPGSVCARVFAGTASAVDIEQVVTRMSDSAWVRGVATDRLVEAVCCNEAAPWAVLDWAVRNVDSVDRAAKLRPRMIRRYRRNGLHPLARIIEAAAYIHPNTPSTAREELGKRLRKRHVKTESIRVEHRRGDAIGVFFLMRGERELGRRFRRRRAMHRSTISDHRRYIARLERMIKRSRNRIRTIKLKKTKQAAKRAAAKRGRSR